MQQDEGLGVVPGFRIACEFEVQQPFLALTSDKLFLFGADIFRSFLGVFHSLYNTPWGYMLEADVNHSNSCFRLRRTSVQARYRIGERGQSVAMISKIMSSAFTGEHGLGEPQILRFVTL